MLYLDEMSEARAGRWDVMIEGAGKGAVSPRMSSLEIYELRSVRLTYRGRVDMIRWPTHIAHFVMVLTPLVVHDLSTLTFVAEVTALRTEVTLCFIPPLDDRRTVPLARTCYRHLPAMTRRLCILAYRGT